MKKRAVISSVATVAMAAVMCVGLTACGTASAKDMKGEEVTEEVWLSALQNEENFTNLKVEGKAVIEVKMGEYSAKATVTTEGKVADGKQYLKMTTKIEGSQEVIEAMAGEDAKLEETVELYYEEQDDKTYIYTKDDAGKWVKNEVTSDNTEDDIEDVLGSAFEYAEGYEYYEYSTEAKGYVLKSDVAEEEGLNITLKFKDGKLCGVLIDMSKEYQGNTMTISTDMVVTYGGQSVTLPTVA